MAVADILKALYGFYTPTGMYSFEFRKPAGGRITEIFLMLPPGSVTVSESPRSSLQPTLRGGYLTDFGNDFKPIQIEGESHFYYAGSTKNPTKEYGQTSNASIEDYIDGYSEFIKLRFLISRYRDYTMTSDGKLYNPGDFSLKSLASTKALRKFIDSKISDGEGALVDQLEMIYHDYDYNEHFKVKVDKLTISRDKTDPWTIKYSIALQAYEVDTKANNVNVFNQVNSTKKSISQLIQDAAIITGSIHPQSIPDEVSLNNGTDTLLVNNQAVSQSDSVDVNVPVETFY